MKRVLAPTFLIAFLFVLGACQGAGSGSTTPAPSTASVAPASSEAVAPALASPDASVWSLVVLGDSEVTGHGDPSGKGWASGSNRIAAVRRTLIRPFPVTNSRRAYGTLSAGPARVARK